jgi:DHA1 family bicyclomycin/chloramphenicol resistance-like MFS transporter
MLRPNTIGLTALLGLLTAFGPVATDMYIPSMPEIGRLLGASTSEVQLTLSAYLIGIAVGQVIYGPLSDRCGRKPVLLGALLLFCVASALCAVAPDIDTLIAARVLQALGGSGAIVLPRAIVRDLYAGERAGRELSHIGAVMSLAPMIAPVLGGILQLAFGWRANFIAILAIGTIAAVIAWRALPETLPPSSAQSTSIIHVLRGYRALAANRAYLAHLGIVSLSYAGLFAWISGSPFVLQGLYGLSPFEFAMAFAIACIGSFAGASVAASLVMRLGLDLTIGLGSLALAVAGLAMIASLSLDLPPVVSLVLCMMLYEVGLMLAMPQAIAGGLTPFPDRAGAASSMIGFAQQTSAAVLGAVVGRTLGHTAWPLAIGVAAMGCLALALWGASRRTRRQAALNLARS